MDSVTILRELWRRRAAVGLVVLAAVLVGLLISFRPGLPPESRQYDVGTATARLLVDTPQSQVIKVNPKGSDTLGVRANVIANLMVEGPAKAAIAKRAGLEPSQLVGIAESELQPEMVSPKAARNPDVNLMKTRVVMDLDGEQLPLVEVRVQAPDPARATALANASVTGLTDYLNARAAADEDLDAEKRLNVAGLGGAEATLTTRGPSPLLSVGAAIFVFLAGCAAIVLVSALAQGWREADASEESKVAELSADDLDLDLPTPGFAMEPPEPGSSNHERDEELTADEPVALGLVPDPPEPEASERIPVDEFTAVDLPPLSFELDPSEHEDEPRAKTVWFPT